jgi:subfamily B ATP-binding cassette protein MsbA
MHGGPGNGKIPVEAVSGMREAIRKRFKEDWSAYIRLLRYSRPYLPRLVAGALSGVICGASMVGFLPVINRVFPQVFNYEGGGLARILGFVGLIVGLALVRGTAQYFSDYFIRWVGHRVVMDLRVAVFSHLQNLSVAYFDKNKTGEMISRTINDTTLLESAVSRVVTNLFRQPVIAVGTVIFLIVLSWRMALIGLVLLPLCMVPVLLYGKKVRRAARQAQERLADIVSIMQEGISGVRVVKAFRRESYEVERFSGQCESFFGRMVRVVRSKAIVEPIIGLVSAAGVSATLVYAYAVDLEWNEFMTFVAGLVMLYDPVKRLSRLRLNIDHSAAAADRIFEILDEEDSVKEADNAEDLSGPVNSVEFRDVSFAYKEDEVLSNISLKVEAGQRTAIVGSSGAGKTTLVNLIPRFFDPVSGQVMINGKDIRRYTLSSLRGVMGLVTQETFLFNDTVANNIGYGQPGASRDDIEEAAQKAYADEFIRGLPEGYDSVVGERGTTLSGGQRQRIAIARAILTDPPILVFDEATSALDTESERLVQAALDDLMEGRTVFAIAHRLSTIMHCHRIYVMDRGRIVEEGSHSELLSKNGTYRRLYDMQFELAPAGR